MDYRLRQALPEDEAWQFAIYASTRAAELARTGWPPAQCEAFARQQHHAQQQHYARHFPGSVCHLILVDADAGETVAGRLWLDERDDRLHILDIALLPAWRGRGLGTRCLLDLAERAEASQRALGIQVEIHNPARRLYERLGFIADGQSQGLYQAMLRPAGACPAHTEECLP